MSTSIEHNTTDERYEIYVDGELAGFTQATPLNGTVLMDHTQVDERFSGRGLAAELVGAALQDVRESGRTVRPTCSYVRRYIDEHPDTADLVDPDYQPAD